MYDKVLILSDIHANLTALREVLRDAQRYSPDAVILMGDIIDYGMRPNEVIEELQKISYPVLANIFGNHEQLLFGDVGERLSSDRGRALAAYTKKLINEKTWNYIREQMNPDARQDLTINGKRILLMHGSQDDAAWGKFDLLRISDDCFREYDYVITGHSHQPHVIPYYFTVDNPSMRNKKKVVFINPGSVGQPRNQNPCAQYALINLITGQIQLNAIPYDIKAEQALYPNFLDSFYRDRLSLGI